MFKRLLKRFHALLCLLILHIAILIPINTAMAAPQTLVILGDSLSAAYGIETDQGWVALLAKQLKTHPLAVQVVNASISGETTSGGLARLPAILASTRPNWVLIALGANDGLRGQSPVAIKNNLAAMISICREHSAQPLLAGMLLPPNYGKVYNERFHRIYHNVATQQQVPLLPFLLKDVGGYAKLMQNDGLHPNATAQPIIFQNVWTFLSTEIFPGINTK